MKTSNKLQEKAIIGIFFDYILWSRISESMRSINNVLHPNELENDFEPDCLYRGYENAFHILGITDENELCSELGGVFFGIISDNKEEAKSLAERIYIEWLVCIKNYYTKTVAV